MATVITKTVKISGGDYTSIAAAESGEQANFVTGDVQKNIDVYDTTDTSAVTFSGSTTDATRFWQLRQLGTGKISGSSIYGPSLILVDNYIRVDGIIIDSSGADAGGVIFQSNAGASASDQRVVNSYLRNTNATPSSVVHGLRTTSSYACKITAVNNRIIGVYRGISYDDCASAPDHLWYNNTIIGSTSVGVNAWGYPPVAGGSVRFKNNLVNGSVGNDYTIEFSANVTTKEYITNASEDATSPNTALRNRTFTFVDTTNYRLASSDTGAKDAGTDLSADAYYAFSTDFEGNSRSTWDIGADEYVSGGGTAVPVFHMHRIQQGMA